MTEQVQAEATAQETQPTQEIKKLHRKKMETLEQLETKEPLTASEAKKFNELATELNDLN
jgi:hypothetical protein